MFSPQLTSAPVSTILRTNEICMPHSSHLHLDGFRTPISAQDTTRRVCDCRSQCRLWIDLFPCQKKRTVGDTSSLDKLILLCSASRAPVADGSRGKYEGAFKSVLTRRGQRR